jgi:hypothetical protein
MHRQQFANIVAIEGNQVRYLFALRLGEPKALAGFDLETDVPGRRQRHRNTGLQHGCCFAHAGSGCPLVCGRKGKTISPTTQMFPRTVATRP